MDRNVLLVDDDASSRLIMAEFLEDSGFHVKVAGDCRSARSMVEDNSFDLVILDMNLPDGTGAELAGYLKERLEDVSLFLLTGDDETEAREKCGEDGALFEEIITKPFSLEELLDKLKSCG